MSVTKEDLKRVTSEYLMTPLQKGLTSRVIFGTEEVDKAKLREQGWKVDRPIHSVSLK